MQEKLELSNIDSSLNLELIQLKNKLIANDKADIALKLDAIADRFIIYHQLANKSESEVWKNIYFQAFLNTSFRVLRDMERSTPQKIILAVCRFIGSLITATLLGAAGGLAFVLLGNLIAPAVGTTLGTAGVIGGVVFGAVLGKLVTDWLVNKLMDQVDSWTNKDVKAPGFFENGMRTKKEARDMVGVFHDFMQAVEQITGKNLSSDADDDEELAVADSFVNA